MNQNRQIHRANYALNKHHRQQLRQQINPAVIEKIQIHPQPSKNYMDAFRTVYQDELEKTLQFHQQKKHRQQYLDQSIDNKKSKDTISPFLNLSNINASSKNRLFTDYDEDRHLKFDTFIQKSYDGGQSFFRQQQQYQKRRLQQQKRTKQYLLQQLAIKDNKKLNDLEQQRRQAELVKENRYMQQQMDYQRQRVQQQIKANQIKTISQQIETEHMKRKHKSIFNFNPIGRHNPIVNPIEYHIDNPYILTKFQNHVNSP